MRHDISYYSDGDSSVQITQAYHEGAWVTCYRIDIVDDTHACTRRTYEYADSAGVLTLVDLDLEEYLDPPSRSERPWSPGSAASAPPLFRAHVQPGRILVEVASRETARIHLRDLRGRTVCALHPASPNSFVLDLAGDGQRLAPGLYTCVLVSPAGKVVAAPLVVP
jgi:hypothetical protein